MSYEKLSLERISSMTIVREIIDHTGVVDELLIFSYSVTDVWIRQLLNLRHEKSIGKIIMVLDYDVMIRHREKLNQLQFVADEVYLTDTHAKVYIAKKQKHNHGCCHISKRDK